MLIVVSIKIVVKMLIVIVHLALVAQLFAHLANAHSWFAACRGVGGVLVGRRVGRGQGGQGGQGHVGGGGEGKRVSRVSCVRVGSTNG